MTLDERWAVVVDAMVEAELQKRVDKGGILRDEAKVAMWVRNDIETQAQRRPEWRQKMVDRHFGHSVRASSKPSCPHCELVFDGRDVQAMRGDDGMLYCRVECARGAPFVTLGQVLLERPELAEQIGFAARVMRRKGLPAADIGLSSLAPGLEPAGADLDW